MNTTTGTNQSTTLSIDGMTCGHCAAAVTKALSEVPGVKVTSVAVGSAVIETVDGWTTAKAVAALEEAGYPAMAGDASAMPRGGGGAKNSGGCCG